MKNTALDSSWSCKRVKASYKFASLKPIVTFLNIQIVSQKPHTMYNYQSHIYIILYYIVYWSWSLTSAQFQVASLFCLERSIGPTLPSVRPYSGLPAGLTLFTNSMLTWSLRKETMLVHICSPGYTFMHSVLELFLAHCTAATFLLESCQQTTAHSDETIF